MVLKVYYIEMSNGLADAIEDATDLFPCFIDTEVVEMDYVEVSINARAEDITSIEKIFAPLM